MSSIRKLKREKARENNRRLGHAGALQGRRRFDSVGHVISERIAENLVGSIKIVDTTRHIATNAAPRSRSDTARSRSLLRSLEPDFLWSMGTERFAKFRESRLGSIMLNVPFKSRWEANIARYFEALRTGIISTDIFVENWIYEPCRFWYPVTRGVTNYVPDFLLVLRGRPPLFVEVKGYFDKKSATAINRFREYYPELMFELIDEKSYREIERKLGPVIPQWERRES